MIGSDPDWVIDLPHYGQIQNRGPLEIVGDEDVRALDVAMADAPFPEEDGCSGYLIDDGSNLPAGHVPEALFQLLTRGTIHEQKDATLEPSSIVHLDHARKTMATQFLLLLDPEVLDLALIPLGEGGIVNLQGFFAIRRLDSINRGRAASTRLIRHGPA